MSLTTPTFKFIDLFSGVGGFHHALSSPEFGGECVLASDIEETCKQVYLSTWPEMKNGGWVGDIRSLTLNEDGTDKTMKVVDKLVPDHDVLCAGFPCQPFSKSGSQLGTLDSTRGTLFFDIMTIVKAKRPKFLILENVRNLAGPRHRETWATIVEAIRELNYRVSDEPWWKPTVA
jgi:DNA (cytosine-5)-methyltransferase 1